MALTFDLTEIHDFRTVCHTPEGKLSDVTHALIWSTMVLGIGHLTAKNVDDFASRAHVAHARLECLPEIVTMVDGQPVSRAPTYAEIRAHVGMRTNVGYESRSAWMRRITRHLLSDSDRAVAVARLDFDAALPTAAAGGQ